MNQEQKDTESEVHEIPKIKNGTYFFLIIVLFFTIGVIYITQKLPLGVKNQTADNKTTTEKTSPTKPIPTTAYLSYRSCTDKAENKITFTHSGDIFVMNEDGTCVKQLTFYGKNSNPLLSPDGKYIAYFSTDKSVDIKKLDGDSRNNTNFWMIKSDGTDPIQITPSDPTAIRTTGTFQWSPDSTTLLFIENRKVKLFTPATKTTRVLADFTDSFPQVGKEVYEHAIWSPDGKQIAVFTFHNEKESFGEGSPGFTKLLFYTLVGKIAKTYDTYPEGGIPYWNPSDNRFYFGRVTNGIGGYDIVSRNIDGTDLKSLRGTTYGADGAEVTKGSMDSPLYGYSYSAFSKDGKTVAVVHTSQNELKQYVNTIWLLASDGTQAHQLYPNTLIPTILPDLSNFQGIGKISWTSSGAIIFKVSENYQDKPYDPKTYDPNDSKYKTALYRYNPVSQGLTTLDPLHIYTAGSLSYPANDDEFSTGVL